MTTTTKTAAANPRTTYHAGFTDGLLGLPPAWLGIDNYKFGYERATREMQRAHDSDELLLLGTSEDQTERLYLHVPSGTEVYMHLDTYDHQWRATVPGYGCSGWSIENAVRVAVCGGPCWNYNGVGVNGLGKDSRRWFTASGPSFCHHIVMVKP